jgi:glucosamine 6-phosphate synthetase-like amidotransferase/phosphosugar isomerase protein
MLMAVIERCGCGHSRIAPHGNSMTTKTGLCVPEKYMSGA